MLVTACAQKSAFEPQMSAAAVSGEVSKPGAMLAYAHVVRFEVAPESMAARISAVQTACNGEQFGTCSVLAINQQAGNYARSSISVRVVPEGVERLVALAADGSEVSERETSAEDLADAVADVSAQQDLLRRERESLQTYQARLDLSVSDLITLSQRLAQVESRLQALGQESANQRRRLETNHLQLEFRSDRTVDDRAKVGFGDLWGLFVDSLTEGAINAAEYTGYLLPLVLLVFPIALIWRWAWRRATGAGRRTSR